MKNRFERLHSQDPIEDGGEVSKTLSKKQLKALAKAAKKEQREKSAEPVVSEKLSPEAYGKLINALEEQIVSSVELLGGLKDATEFVSEGGDSVENILTLLGREVDLATEQGDLPAIDMHNQRRSAVGKLISAIQEIKTIDTLKQMTGQEIARLFDRAITGNLTLVEADAEIAKFSPESKPTSTLVEAESPVSEASQPSKKLEKSKPTKPGPTKPRTEEAAIDLSNPATIAEFTGKLRKIKDEVDISFDDGSSRSIRMSSLADILQNHIRNLQGMVDKPEKQKQYARGVIRVASEKFGYRNGLQKLFTSMGFIESEAAKIDRIKKQQEVFRAEIMGTHSFTTLYDVLATHRETIQEGGASFPIAEIISVLGEVERAAGRKDGQPVAKSLMAMLPVDCGVQAKAAELFLQINPLIIVEPIPEQVDPEVESPADVGSKGTKSKGQRSPAGRVFVAKPSSTKKAIRVVPGMSLADIVIQKDGLAPSKSNRREDEGGSLGVGGSLITKRATGATRDVIPPATGAVGGIQITDDLVARAEAAAVERVTTERIQVVRTELDRLVEALNQIWFAAEKWSDKGLVKKLTDILPALVVIDKEAQPFTNKTSSEKLAGYEMLFEKYQKILKNVEGIKMSSDRLRKFLGDQDPVASADPGVPMTQDQPVPAAKNHSQEKSVIKKPKTTTPILVAPITPSTKPIVTSTGSSSEVPKTGGKKDTVHLILSPEVQAQMKARREAEAKKKSEKIIGVTQPARSETPQDILEKEFNTLRNLFTEAEQKLVTRLSQYVQDAEIQAKKPKEAGIEIILMLEGKELKTKIDILKEGVITYGNALRDIEAILTQRKQNQPTPSGTAGSTQAPGRINPAIPGPATQPQTIPQPPAQPTIPQAPGIPQTPKKPRTPRQKKTPPPVPVAPPPTPPAAPNWFKRNWARIAGIAGIAGALLGNELGKNSERRNREQDTVTAGTRATTPERSTTDTPRINRESRAPRVTLRTPEASTLVRNENYKGINFDEVLSKYPNASRSEWVVGLFTNIDQELVRIQSPQDFDAFFTHYFGELNVGTQDFIPGRDPEVSRKQFDEYARIYPDGTKFGVKIKYRWIGAEDLKLRLALMTQLRAVLVLSDAQFASVPGAQQYIRGNERKLITANAIAILMDGLAQLDPSFDPKTITRSFDAALLDRLIAAQKKVN